MTDADGRYAFDKVYSEQALIVAVADDRWAAPYQGGVLVRRPHVVGHVGQQLGDVDLQPVAVGLRALAVNGDRGFGSALPWAVAAIALVARYG